MHVLYLLTHSTLYWTAPRIGDVCQLNGVACSDAYSTCSAQSDDPLKCACAEGYVEKDRKCLGSVSLILLITIKLFCYQYICFVLLHTCIYSSV